MERACKRGGCELYDAMNDVCSRNNSDCDSADKFACPIYRDYQGKMAEEDIIEFGNRTPFSAIPGSLIGWP